MEILRKISSKTVMGGGPAVIRPLATVKPTLLYTVYGMASRVKRGESDNGPWVALIGRFEAVRATDGEVYSSPQCFLPDPMGEMLASQLEQTEPVLDPDGKAVLDTDGKPKTKPVNDSIQFGLEIGVKIAETAVGYEYTTSPIVESSGADPLADLRTKVPALKGPDTKADTKAKK